MLGFDSLVHKNIMLYRPNYKHWIKMELDEAIVVTNGETLCLRTSSNPFPLRFDHQMIYGSIPHVSGNGTPYSPIVVD